MRSVDKRRADAARLPAGAEWWTPVQGSTLTGEVVGVLHREDAFTGLATSVVLVRPDGADRTIAIGRAVNLGALTATLTVGDRLQIEYCGWRLNSRGRMHRKYRVETARKGRSTDG